MRQVIKLLFVASRGLAICAMLAGLAAGLLAATVGAGFMCFDSCPTREDYFAHLGPVAVQVMMPCILLEVLALAIFLAYCIAIGQAQRAVKPILFLLIGGLSGVAALYALLLYGQATVPVDPNGYLLDTPVQEWAQLWGLALMLVAVAWSGVLAYMQWDGARR
jgi:hypothetical protein